MPVKKTFPSIIRSAFLLPDLFSALKNRTCNISHISLRIDTLIVTNTSLYIHKYMKEILKEYSTYIRFFLTSFHLSLQ